MSETVRVGRNRYLAANNLSVESYAAPGFPIYVWRWAVWVPNPGRLPYHDLHHVVTGYSTGVVGEAEISAYELRGGCHSWMIFGLCVGAIAWGLCLSPRRVWRAWRRARGTRTLYDSPIPYEDLLDMELSALREHLGLPAKGMKDEG